MGYSKLGRNSSARKALFRSVLVSLLNMNALKLLKLRLKKSAVLLKNSLPLQNAMT